MPTEKFTFQGHSGHDLAARLDLPAGRPAAAAVFAHCFTCGKDIAAARRIADRLAALGIAVLRFDFTGLGHSGGEFSNTHFTSNVEDLVLAARAMEARGWPVQLLVGHSLGGAAIIRAAAELPSVRAVATLGAPSDPGHVEHLVQDHADEIRDKGAADVTLAGRNFTIRKAFLDDIRAASVEETLKDLKKALLILHSPVDQTVGIDNAAALFTAARHPKSFVTLDDADHLLSRSADAEYAASVIAAWAGRYLDLPKPAAPIGAPEGIVRVAEADPDGFLQDVSVGPRHHVLADEPEAYGGTDAGFTPYQLLSAGLGACTSMTVRMYARRKKWPLTHVSVDVTHDKIHAADCEHCQTQDGKIDRLTRNIVLEGDLSEDQRARLLEIADKCPVHRTLESEVDIVTRVGVAE